MPPTELTTLNALKEQLGIDLADYTHDNMLNRIIWAVSAAMESYCNRSFAPAEREEVIRPSYTDTLLLSAYPVLSVTSLTYGDDLLAEGSYRLEAERGALILLDGEWRDEVTVVYSAGYVLPGGENIQAKPPITRNLPYDLEDACLLWCTMKYNTDSRTGIKSEGVDGLRVSYDDLIAAGGIPAAVRALIDPYRRLLA